MPRTCPHCGAALPDVRGASCPVCRAELPPPDPTPGAPPPAAEPHAPGPTAVPEATDERTARFWLTLFGLTPHAYVTRALVGVNLAVFVAMIASGVSASNPTSEDLLRWGADFEPKTLDGEWWRIFTCVFVHIGVIHVAFNMWVLAVSGRLMERMLGNTGFLLLYLISGLGGSLASLLWHPDLVSAGASGAIFGIYGGLLGVLQKQYASIPTAALAGLKHSGVTFLVLNLILGLSQPNIDMAAHVGGFITGFFCGLLLSRPFTPEGAAGRPAQNILTAGLGAAAIVSGAMLVSAVRPSGAEAARELERFEATERRALDTYNAAVAKADRGEITDAALAAVVERDVLPEWRATRERLAAQTGTPDDLGKRVAALVEYMRLRQEGWELFVQSVRQGDAAKGERSREKHRLADEAAKRLGNDR
ncbi:MAG: rhomboid family intramembrane serine protease [Planctomycetes bacterium]|nr:rhomboid family intramembrane serine protease [Planctomycetota bacterium]